MFQKRLISVLVVLLLSLMAWSMPTAGATTALTDSFEYADMAAAGEAGWSTSGDIVELSTEKARTGSQSVKIVTNGGNERIMTQVTVEPGRSYKYEAWVFVAPGFTASGENDPQARIFLRQSANGGDSYGYKAVYASDTEWQRLALIFTPAAEQTSVCLWLNVGGAVGTVYYDDVSFTETQGTYFENGDFETTTLETTYRWADGWSLSPATKVKGTDAYISTDEKNSGRYSMACPMSAATGKLYIPVSNLEPGAYYTVRANIKTAYDEEKKGTLTPSSEGIRLVFTPNINASISSTDHWMFGSGAQVFSTNNAWQQLVRNVRIPTTYTGTTGYVCITTGKLRTGWEDAGVVLYVDDITLTKLQNHAAFYKTDSTAATGIESSLVVKGAFVGDTSNTSAVALIAMYREVNTSVMLADVVLVTLAGYEAEGSITKYSNFSGTAAAYSAEEFQNLNQAITVPEDCTKIKVMMLNSASGLSPLCIARTLE